MDRYWSFDGEIFETHATPAEAKAACEETLDWCRDEAGDGWNTEIVEHIAWGTITEATVMVDREDHHPECGRVEGEEDEDEGCHNACDIPGSIHDFHCRYELRQTVCVGEAMGDEILDEEDTSS